MVALTQDRDTPSRAGRDFEIQAAPSLTFYAGGILALNAAGLGTPGATATTLKPLGRIKERVVTNATDAVNVRFERGVFRYANSTAGDLITAADIGSSAWMVDDQTVAKTNGSNTRSVAGIIRAVDALGVWVEF